MSTVVATLSDFYSVCVSWAQFVPFHLTKAVEMHSAQAHYSNPRSWTVKIAYAIHLTTADTIPVTKKYARILRDPCELPAPAEQAKSPQFNESGESGSWFRGIDPVQWGSAESPSHIPWEWERAGLTLRGIAVLKLFSMRALTIQELGRAEAGVCG
ncbi:hypothetical protein BD779DRAFT_1477883 [Infundibulicybe gibba]|nr:hypothetical protein BD779DRAFT_1477883 [Infundibulicybe gibba]